MSPATTAANSGLKVKHRSVGAIVGLRLPAWQPAQAALNKAWKAAGVLPEPPSHSELARSTA